MHNKTFYGETLFPHTSQNALKTYKYSGSDNSILYAHIYSPLCNYLVENWTPKTLAPNIITLTGFMLNTIPIHIYLLITYKFSVNAEIPSWINFFSAFTLFVYLILDNMDGKQARKIGESSPLGLFFDHGCDCISTPLLAIVFLHIFGFSGFYYFFIVFVSSLCFFLKTYEEYVFKVMELGVINPVTEGITCLVLLAIFSGIVGNGFWGNYGFFGRFLFRDYMFIVLGGFSIFESFSSVFMICKQIGFLEFYFDCLDFIFLSFVTLSLAYGSVDYLFVKEIKYLAYFFAFLYTKITFKVIISHLFDVKVKRAQLDIILPCLAVYILHLFCYFLPENRNLVFFFEIFFIFLTIFYFFYLISFWINVIYNFSMILGIKILSINEKRDEKIALDEENGDFEEGTVEIEREIQDEIEKSIETIKSLVEDAKEEKKIHADFEKNKGEDENDEGDLEKNKKEDEEENKSNLQNKNNSKIENGVKNEFGSENDNNIEKKFDESKKDSENEKKEEEKIKEN